MLPGAVRASVGLATTADDLDRLVDALTVLTTDGPRWTYRSSRTAPTAGPTPTRGRGPAARRPRMKSGGPYPPSVPGHGPSASATIIWPLFRTPSLR